MIPKFRDFALPLAFSAFLSGALGAEFVLQNGVGGYKGCEDASLLSTTCWLVMNEEHFKDEYGSDNAVMGGLDNNYDHVPYLFVNFCPS